MLIPQNYLYLSVSLLLFFVWLILFVVRKDVRREMLLVSSLIGLLTFLCAPTLIGDYWHPAFLYQGTFHIEDFLFGFVTSGISATLYEVIFNKHFRKKSLVSRKKTILLFPLVGLNIGLYFLWVYVYPLGSIYAHILSLLVLGIIFVAIRNDLFYDGMVSGLLFGFLYFNVFYLFTVIYPGGVSNWWIGNKSNITIIKVPLEELLWAFSWGFVCGPFYEFFYNLKLQTLRR